eukprot:scaffold40832_cov63-Phaeocystis_antarctica.AAC.2
MFESPTKTTVLFARQRFTARQPRAPLRRWSKAECNAPLPPELWPPVRASSSSSKSSPLVSSPFHLPRPADVADNSGVPASRSAQNPVLLRGGTVSLDQNGFIQEVHDD